LFERDPQRAGADGIEGVDDELILTTWRIDREFSTRANLQTVGWSKTNANVCRAKALGSQLRVFVFEREVPMTGRVVLEVRDLTLDPNGREARFESVSDRVG
jgi:hypothetical protein